MSRRRWFWTIGTRADDRRGRGRQDDRLWRRRGQRLAEGRRSLLGGGRRGVKEGKWDFRALVVNDRFVPRAHLAKAGRLEHESRFPVLLDSTAGGGWERKPSRSS